MNKMLKTAILATATLGFVAAPVLADKAAEKAIGARKAQMQLYSFNLGQLGAMAKGEVEYNAETAKAAAENLAALAALNGGAMWRQGTDSTAMPGVSRAKLEAWTTYPKASNIGKALAEDFDLACRFTAITFDKDGSGGTCGTRSPSFSFWLFST